MGLFTESLFVDVALLVLGLLTVVYFLIQRNFNHWKKKDVPFLPPEPIFGNFRDVMLAKKNLGEHLMSLYFKSKGRPYVGFYAFYRPILLIRDLDVVKKILVKDFNYFTDRSFSPNEDKDPLFNKCLVGMNGPRWRHLRVKLSPTFTSGKMKMIYKLVEECGRQMIDYYEDAVGNDSQVLEVKEIGARFTTDIISSVVFGLQSNSLKNPNSEFRFYLRKVVELDTIRGVKLAMAFLTPDILSFFNLQVWDPSIAHFLRRVVWDTVEHRERTGLVRRDFLDMLMQLRRSGQLEDDEKGASDADNSVVPGDVPVASANDAATNGSATTNGVSSPEKYPLDGDDFVAQAFIFLAAGFETSSSALTFTLFELARHPDAQTRLRQEVRESLRANGGRITYESLQNMTYLHQVVTEVLRLYPILPFLDRVAVQDYTIPGTNVRLKKGDAIMVPSMAIQRDPQYFEDPESFIPERWSPENKHKIVPYSYLAFGEGPRICIGMRMGLMQTKVGLAYLMNKFEVRPCASTPDPIKFDPKFALLSTKGGMKLNVARVPGAVQATE